MAENKSANKEFLTRLFDTVSSEKGSPSSDLSLNRLYERTQRARDVWDPVENLLQDLDAEKQNDIEDAVSVLAVAFEHQGFINGFRLGMMLREELTG